MSACGAVSTKPVAEPTPPRVDCKQGAGSPLPPLPPADQAVTCSQVGCWLSEAMAKWIAATFGVVDEERRLRAAEHACLDKHEREGLIRQ